MDFENLDSRLVQSILQSCPVCFLIQEQGVVTHCTPYVKGFLGISVGCRLADYIVDAASIGLNATGDIKDFQNWERIDIKSESGDIKPMEIKTYSVHSNGRDLKLTWLQDVGRLERAESTLKFVRNDIREQARISRERTAKASYELRKSLNSIFGLTELLSDGGESEYLTQLKQAAKDLLVSMDALINPEAKKAEKTSFSVKKVLTRLENAIRILLDKRKLEYRVLCQDDIPDLMGYPKHIQDVLILLTKNAIGFTNEGAITIKATEHDRDEDSRTLLFSVRDTGCGMPKDQVEALFPQFAGEDDAEAGRYKNGGLGITTVHTLVDSMGGRMWCESTQGVGTTVYFTVRCENIRQDDSGNTAHVAAVHDNNAAQNAKILIVDDNRVNQMVACELLKRRGYTVATAASGVEAVDIIRGNNDFSLVLMDVYMPDMDGPTATKIIRGMCPQLPIVALTACAMPGDREMCLSLGMNDYFTKPFEVNDFLRLVSRWT